jgi:hypothetical protein
MALSVTHTFTSGIADDASAQAAGQVLPSHWNATHTISGTLPAANVTAPGSDTQVLFNDGNALGADADLTWNKTSNTMGLVGHLLVGNSTSLGFDAGGGIDPSLQVNGTDANTGALSVARFTNSAASQSRLIFAKSRGATIGDFTVVQSGDRLGEILVNGSDDTDFADAAAIRFEVDGTPGNNDMPGRILLMTSTDGGTTLAERMRINSFGQVGITGAGVGAINQTVGQFGPTFQVNSTSDAAIAVHRYTANSGGPVLVLGKSRHATVGSHTVVEADDALGLIWFGGSDGTHFEIGAEISAKVDGTPGNNDMPTRLAFSTTPDGSTSAIERMRIDSKGSVMVGGGADPLVGGFRTVLAANLGAEGGTNLGIGIYQNTIFGGSLVFRKSRNTTINSHTAVLSEDIIGYTQWTASDGTAFREAATIVAIVDGTPGAGDMPGRLQFMTTRDGSATAVERMRINSVGQVVIGGGAAQNFGGYDSFLQLQYTGGEASINVVRWGDNSLAPKLIFGKSRGASVGTHAAVQPNESPVLLIDGDFAGRRHQQRIAIRRRLRDRIRRQHCARAGTIFNDDGLAERRFHRLLQQPGDNVDAPSRGIADKNVNWLARVILRFGSRYGGGPRSSTGSREQMASCQHCVSSEIFCLSVSTRTDRRLERQARIPWKIDPGILRDLGDERVDQGASHRLCIHSGEMRVRQQVAHDARGLAGIDQVVDDQHALSLRVQPRHLGRDAFDHRNVALVVVIAVAQDRYGLDHSHVEFARNDGRRHQTAARDANNCIKRSGVVQAPGESARVAVELVP